MTARAIMTRFPGGVLKKKKKKKPAVSSLWLTSVVP